MATEKKGGGKTKPKSGIAEVSKKPTKSKSVKSLPETLQKEAGGAKLKVVPPASISKKGIDKARKNRLKKAGIEIDCCPITKLPLDTGPRAGEWLAPVEYDGEIMSKLAQIILESGITADQLRKAADSLRKK